MTREGIKITPFDECTYGWLRNIILCKGEHQLYKRITHEAHLIDGRNSTRTIESRVEEGMRSGQRDRQATEGQRLTRLTLGSLSTHPD